MWALLFNFKLIIFSFLTKRLRAKIAVDEHFNLGFEDATVQQFKFTCNLGLNLKNIKNTRRGAGVKGRGKERQDVLMEKL